jgi:2-dehydro-3-deoxyphosphogluconate aldolase/(4S)-4-hydroxy-2-oxoglutarate aldolase
MDTAIRLRNAWVPDIVAVIRKETGGKVSEETRPEDEAGVTCIEVALVTCRGLDVIERLAKTMGFAVGVATALDAGAAQLAIRAGTAFRLWPGAAPGRVDAIPPYADLPTSGASGPAEAPSAPDGSTDIVKLFPARLAHADPIDRPAMPVPQRALIPNGIGKSGHPDGRIMVIGIGRHLPARTSASRYARIREQARQLIETAQMRVSRLNMKHRDRSTMPAALTLEQKRSLAELVAEHAGMKSSFLDFCDYLLLLFEDLPGFETATPGHALLREIWDLYCGQTAQPARS